LVEGRRVNGVAAEIAVEVGMGFEEGDRDAAAGEEQAEHGPGRSGPHDTAACLGAGNDLARSVIRVHCVNLRNIARTLTAAGVSSVRIRQFRAGREDVSLKDATG